MSKVLGGKCLWLRLVAATGPVLACNPILGIEDARLDPLYEDEDEDAGNAELPLEAAAPPSLCQQYCAAVTQNCSGADAVYPTEELCLAACAYLPEGTAGDEIGNTIHCRLHNAELARTTGEFEDHCPAAGPGGSGVCGDDCSAYCMLFQGACLTSFEQAYLGLPDCLSQCASLPTSGGYNVSLEMRAGNTIECRLYHVSAATADPNRHCAHAAGEPPCVD